MVLAVAGLAGCSDYLDKEPLSDIEENDPYKNFKNFQGFVEELYNSIPIMTSQEYHCCWNFGEDDYWEPKETRLMTYAIDQGNFWGWNESQYSYFNVGGNTASTERMDKGHLYTLCWRGINKCNIGLANYDKLVDATSEERDLIKGQLLFFRGWFHFMLMQYWGGLPYIDNVLGANDPMRLPRLNYQETAEKAAEDFQAAAEILPIDRDQTTVGKTTLGRNWTRANKIMALAYLGKDLLWAGSPLMNKESTGSPTYNAELCKRAAEAFGQALSLTESTGRYELADFDHYSDIFYTYKQNIINGVKEVIFYENLAAGNPGAWRWNLVNDFRPQIINGSGIKSFPCANYVDYFGMANGLPIPDITKKDEESGYDPEYPFRNRDPRFYKDIVYDAVQCVKDGSKVLDDQGNPNPNRQYASLYKGGDYRTQVPDKACFTGYMNMKFVSQYMNDWDGYKDNNILVMPMMRLADVYLMYAEAAAQGYGSPTSSAQNYSLTALQAVNKIRARAGVADIADKYAGSLEGFMSELQRERAVELAFEGHRFVDLRRWLLLDKAPYTYKKAVYFDRAEDMSDDVRFADPANAHVKNLREEILLERHYTERHYWFPFLKDDVNMYSDFKQNPGWD